MPFTFNRGPAPYTGQMMFISRNYCEFACVQNNIVSKSPDEVLNFRCDECVPGGCELKEPFDVRERFAGNVR